MRALHQKLLRDLWRTRGQVITISLVLAAGVAAYVAMTGAHRALTTSRDAYYARHAFPDVFVQAARAPDRVADDLAAIPGVASVETRLVEPVLFRIEGAARSPIGRAISIQGTPRSIVLRRGRAIADGRADEVLVLETFANAHRLAPGDHIEVVIGGHELRPRIVGLAISPEWIFPAESGVGSLREFGVLWMDEDALAAASGKRGVFDDATLHLQPGASHASVIAAIDRALEPWGGRGAYGRDRQSSHRALSGELDQLRLLAFQIPAVFLLVAAFLLHSVLSRMVQVQREELAVLRALGYSRWALARHVLAYAAVLGVAGGVVGVVLGAWMGGALLGVYDDFFHFPLIETPLDAWLLVTATLFSIVPATTGAMVAIARAVRLSPADAMRPPAPARYRRGLLSRLGLARLAGPSGRMIVRDLERRPAVTAVSIVGIAFAGAIVVMGRFNLDAVDHILDVVLARSMREDMTVVLARPVPRSELDWFRNAPGVLDAQPMRMLPVRIHHGWRTYDAPLTAWSSNGTLRRVLDGEARPVRLPADGVMLTELLGERLGLEPGDRVQIERLDEQRGSFEVTVTALVDERMGMNAYMDLDALARALGEAPVMTAVLLQVEEGSRGRLLHRLADVPAVVQVAEVVSVRDAFQAQSGGMIVVMTLIVVGFAAVIAVGIIYNTARIALSERNRDLATLRVLGYTRAEVAQMLLGQLAVYVIVALPLAMIAGHALITLLMSQVDPEQYRFPTVVSPATYAFASLVVIGASLATGLVVRRKLDHIDLVSALKARD
jgi:putative ABC transport system permease protein